MTNQQYRIHLSVASPSEIERTARELRAIREGFLSTATLATHIPRSMILESWQRCRSMHVNPARRYAPLAIAREAQLRNLREANELLIRASRSVMSHLTDFLAGSGYVVVLSDAKGCLLDVIGDAGIRRRLARIDFVPGGNWSEAAAGTNAIGTALADGHVVQLMAAEHYCDGWQDLTCTAAPIRHPLTGEIIGILDVTGDYRLIRPFLTSFLATAALEIQQELRSFLTSVCNGKPAALIQAAITSHYLSPGGGAERVDTSVSTFGQSACKETAQHLVCGQGEQKVVTASFPNGTTPFEITMHNNIPWHQNGKKLLETPLVDDIRSRLNLQERRACDAERLAAAAAAISASLDLDVALENVAEQTAHLLQLEGAASCLFNGSDEGLSLHIWSRQNPLIPTGNDTACLPLLNQSERRNLLWLKSLHALEALLERTEAVSLIRERGEPVIIDDIYTSSLLPAALVEQMGIRSIAMLPLTTARGVIGFIAAPKCTSYHWVADDVRLALAFAAQSATAIENARLFASLQQHNRRIEVFNAMAQLLSTLPDPNQHLNLILQRIVEVRDLDAGMILLLDQHMSDLALIAHCGLPKVESLDLRELPLRPLHEVACLVVALGEALIVCGEESSERIMHKPLRAVGFCDLMAVPLAASNTILGVLLVGSYNPRGLTEEDLALFTTIGQQLGMALKNAELLRAASEMEALREADRLKSGFIAAVSHDLRSPLTAIRASVESLLDHGGIQSAGTQEHLLHNIAGQARRLGRLVDQLLDLSRIEAGVLSLDRDWTELPVLISDTLARFEELNGGFPVEYDISPDLPLQYVDPDRLVQVLWNLLENASKYALSQASIKIEARWTEAEVLIGVADRGPGIPEDEHEKIFQHFYRLNRDYRTHTQGSGLGLAICRGIVEAHGGRIWAEDRPGGGSIFRFALPLTPIDAIGLEALEERGELCAVTAKER